jgi:toxin YoeB
MIKSFSEFINENNKFYSPKLDSNPQRGVSFTRSAFEQYNDWLLIDKKKFNNIKKLIVQTMRDPFVGSNAEPLVGDKSGKWSKHIDLKHRLVYSVSDTEIKIFSCYEHYGDK